MVKWFPDRRGLATGMAIMGFGFAALIFGPIMAKLFETVGVTNAFYILGVIYTVVILSSALYIERPPVDYAPNNAKANDGKKVKQDMANIDANSALKTSRFYYIWIMMFINISCGIAIISAASPMMQEKFNYTPMQAATIVGLIGVEIAFLVVLLTVITMYGGGFSTLPAFLGDLFGTKQLGAIHGLVLAAWGLAGVVGPTLYDIIKESTGSLDQTLVIFSSLFIIALFVSVLMKIQVGKAHKKQQADLASVA